MKITKTNLEGLVIIEPRVFGDDRGYFYESYNENAFHEAGLKYVFVQDNQSKSLRGVIRGLHYQLEPYAQTKLIRVIEGNIIDVAVDIRKGSPTFGKWFAQELSGENKLQLLIPKGFAHGFSVISGKAVVLYKTDDFYMPETERGIVYNDPSLNIDWKLASGEISVSEKDNRLPRLQDAEINFKYRSA